MAGMFIALCILCIVLFFINNNLSKKLKKVERSLKGGKNSDKGKVSNKESKENQKDSKKEKNTQQNGEEIVSKAVIPTEGTEVSEDANEAEAYDNYADESEYADNNVEYNDDQAYDNNPEYSEEGYTEGGYSEEGYSEDGYAEGQEYSEEGYSENGYSEDDYEAESDAAVYNYDQNYQDEYAGEEGAYSDSEYSEDGDGEDYSEEEYADSAVSEAEYETYDDAVLDEADYQEEVSEQDGYTGNASFERNIPNAGDTGYFENPFNITRKAEKPSVSYSFKQYDGGDTGNIEVPEVAAASEVTNSSGIVNMDSAPLYANVQKKDIGGITGCIFTTTEIGGVNASGVMDDAPTFETKGIVLEEAIDNNSNVNVPPAQEISSREEAMRKRPYGIDSAFDVVDEKDYNPSKADQNTVEKVEIIHKPNVEETNTLNAAAAAFANIKKSVEESEDEEVSNDIPDNDEDIVFPTMHSDE
jgi:Sec-independent protein translocase protein TatA